MRVVQLIPPGSACSIAFGIGVVNTPPGSVQGLHLVVSDINAARAELADRGADVGEVQDLGGGPVRPLQRSGRERLDLAAAALFRPTTCRPRADGSAGSPRSRSMLALSPAHSTLVGPY